MLFGLLCTSVVLAALGWLICDVRTLKQLVKIMSQAQDQVAQDIAAIKAGVANWAATAQAAIDAKLAEAKAAWDADDEAKWNQVHADLSGIAATVGGVQPITPPATPDNPNPDPVPSPSDPAADAGAGTDQGATS